MTSDSTELEGLRVVLDKLVYHRDPVNLPTDQPHAFIYFLTIRNLSDRSVTLLGRKWVIRHEDDTHLVVEGDKIVGETPCIVPGDSFSYNSHHVTSMNAVARGSFHGVDELGNKIHVRIPEIRMEIPKDQQDPDPELS